MEVRTQRENGTLITEVSGRIDGATAREFEVAVRSAMREDDAAVIMDLEGVSYVSSAGLRAILLIAKELGRREAKLALCSLSESIHDVFEVSGFGDIVRIHANRAEALSKVGG